MKDYIENRVIEVACYVVSTKQNIRDTARRFGVCKSTVHRDLRDRLPKVNPQLAKVINKILDSHLEVRHLNGGEATRRKYKQ